MRLHRLLFLSALALPLACQGTDPVSDSGIEGLALRGPIQPVCQVGVPCSEPLMADFTVYRNGNVVLRFSTDQDGRFAINLPPGRYTVVPDESTPIFFPERQSREVVVPDGELVEVLWDFDTGIR